MTEVWKPIVESKGKYEISNFGRVKSHAGLNARILKPYNMPSKHFQGTVYYKLIDLRIDGKRCTRLIHRLVAEAFVPNPNDYDIVNHKDNNPSNNNVDNLEWCTRQYNNNYNGAQERRVESYNHAIALRRAREAQT